MTSELQAQKIKVILIRRTRSGYHRYAVDFDLPAIDRFDVLASHGQRDQWVKEETLRTLRLVGNRRPHDVPVVAGAEFRC